jgi:hypothetical protein
LKTALESTTEALYFRAFQSYLLQQPDLKDNYGMLLDHYKNHPDSFKALTKNDLLRIKQMQDDVQNNRYTLLCGSTNFSNDVIEALKKEKSDKRHKEICDGLIDRMHEIFTPVIGPIIYCSTEHPTMFGPIDIVLQSGETSYVIEVKTNTATHAIVGQVSKYFIGLSLKLITRHFDKVKMMTLCPGYDKASLAGLKRIGADPFILNTNTLEINRL